MIIPPKLQSGDEIRIIAPARSLSLLQDKQVQYSTKRLEQMGFHVTFGKHVKESDMFVSSSVASRVEDLHDAFRDKNVKGILTVIGGFNSNQLLDHIDYRLVRRNPKVLCGFSDITALSNAIYAKTGLVTYSGPHFSSFGMHKGFEYTQEYFRKCVMQDGPVRIKPPVTWSDDAWYLNQNKRTFIKNDGYWVLSKGRGSIEGTIIGGNMCTFNLLQGTPYMPQLKDAVLFLEDDEQEKEATALVFDRYLQSLIHQPGFSGVRAIVIGRFQNASQMTREKLTYIVKTKPELDNIPVVANVDFGHTKPVFTFPIGGKVRLQRDGQLMLYEH